MIAGIDYLPSLQLIPGDQLLHWVLTCPWGPQGRPLLWVLVHQPRPWCKERKCKQRDYFVTLTPHLFLQLQISVVSSEMMIHLVALETHVTFEAGESILSLKMKEIKKREN